MQIKWEEDAISDLINLRNHIQQENPTAAEKIAHKILNSIDTLIEHPLLGKAGRIHKTRELIITASKYAIIYKAEAENITILRVFHQSQLW